MGCSPFWAGTVRRRPQPECFFCQGLYAWNGIFTFVSVLQELHIAVTMLFQAFRAPRWLYLSRRWVPVVWTAGIAAGILNFVWYHEVATNGSWWLCPFEGRHGDNSDLLLEYFMIGTPFVASVAAYFAVVWVSLKSAPGSVQRKLTGRLQLYPVNYLLTYGPALACALDFPLTHTASFVFVAKILRFGNGFFSTLTYAMNSRFAAGLLRHGGRVAEGRVASEFVLMFACEAEVVLVSADGRAARAQSEREMAVSEMASSMRGRVDGVQELLRQNSGSIMVLASK
mmetsp:Transcript_30518/g.68930  ORF Transcript_30518/g.68930 Transcript_30518/m.68930 type:complete len:284 (-) Transcript_30518:16-867(-)